MADLRKKEEIKLPHLITYKQIFEKRFYCNNCQIVLEEDDLVEVKEEIGEAWGHPAYEYSWVCPYCHDIPTKDVPDEYDEDYEDDDDYE